MYLDKACTTIPYSAVNEIIYGWI